MQTNDKSVLIYSTSPSLDVAERIAASIVERGEAACVNILPGMVSVYSWQGAIERDEEVVMLVKTRAGKADAAIATIKELHPYDVPAALVVPVDGGSQEFVNWIAQQTGGDWTDAGPMTQDGK